MPFDSSGVWRPDGIKQESFLALPEEIPEAIIGGGVRTGKTELLLLYGVLRQWHLIPGFKQVYARRQLNQIRNEVVPRSKLIFNKLEGWKYNASYMYWEFQDTGAMIWLGHVDQEDDVRNYDTMEINLFTPDELQAWTEWMYLYISLERVRKSPGSKLPAITRGAAMPGDKGHTWIKRRFVDPAPEGGKIIIGRGNRKRVYIHATLADSERVDEEYSKQLDALPEAERQAKKYGNWNSYTGQVFEEFRTRHYPGEPENAVHVIDSFEIPSFWPRLFVLDWGFAALCYLLKLAISPQKRVYAYQERYWLKTKISEWAPFVKEDIELENPRSFVVCRSAKQDRGQENTIQQDIENEIGRSIELAQSGPGSRIDGKQLIHEYLRWKPKHIPKQELPEYNEEYALWILRNRGLEEYKSYMNSLIPQQPEVNLPKLQIFSNLKKLQEAIQACVYDKNHPEDVEPFDGDDPYDSLRYGLDRVGKYFREAEKEFAKVQEIAILEEMLKKTGDYNSFYRKAQIVHKQSGGPRAVRRYHH